MHLIGAEMERRRVYRKTHCALFKMHLIGVLTTPGSILLFRNKTTSLLVSCYKTERSISTPQNWIILYQILHSVMQSKPNFQLIFLFLVKKTINGMLIPLKKKGIQQCTGKYKCRISDASSKDGVESEKRQMKGRLATHCSRCQDASHILGYFPTAKLYEFSNDGAPVFSSMPMAFMQHFFYLVIHS